MIYSITIAEQAFGQKQDTGEKCVDKQPSNAGVSAADICGSSDTLTTPLKSPAPPRAQTQGKHFIYYSLFIHFIQFVKRLACL